ncbi:ATP-grasp domain-containing protein, partial [Candidatus Parcubacteria bacterium]|nr:ATP-grasp domain-containing protein [Candidatus Parcubacteria bacterium]
VSDNCDYSLFACAFLGAMFNLPATSLEAAQLTTNKYNMRERLSHFNIPQPKFILCKTEAEAETAAQKIGLPVVIKPADNRGSFGVKAVFAKKDIKPYFLHALSNTHCRYALVEKYIEGINLTVDGFCFKDGHLCLGLASKKILMTKENKPVTQEVIYPAEIKPELVKRVLENNEKVVKALDLKFGATHVEYNLTKEGVPYLLEIANRGGGVMTSASIIPSISGVSMQTLLLKAALGETPKKPNGFDVLKNKSAILHFFIFNKRGKIKKISGVEKVKKRKDVLLLFLMVKVGDVIGEILSGAHRHGFCILVGENRQDVRKKAKEVVSQIDLQVV